MTTTSPVTEASSGLAALSSNESFESNDVALRASGSTNGSRTFSVTSSMCPETVACALVGDDPGKRANHVGTIPDRAMCAPCHRASTRSRRICSPSRPTRTHTDSRGGRIPSPRRAPSISSEPLRVGRSKVPEATALTRAGPSSTRFCTPGGASASSSARKSSNRPLLSIRKTSSSDPKMPLAVTLVLPEVTTTFESRQQLRPVTEPAARLHLERQQRRRRGDVRLVLQGDRRLLSRQCGRCRPRRRRASES